MKKSIIFIGFGSIGQRHFANLSNTSKDTKFKTYIGENKKEITKRPNNKLSLEKIEIISSKNQLKIELELLKAGDIVLICNRSSDHSSYLKFVNLNVRNDVLIIVEKPLATNIFDLDQISDLRKNNNIFVISQFRCSPVLSELKKIIKSQIYGNLVSFSLINHEAIQKWHPWENYKDSYATKKSSGGGCLLTQIHDLDILFNLLGLPKKIHFFFGDGNNLEIDVDDYYVASIVFKAEKDIPGTITSSYYSNAKPRMYYFTFDNAFISWNLNKDILEINFEKDLKLKSFSRNDLFIHLANQMINISESLKEEKDYEIENNSGLISINEALIFNEWLFSNI